MVYLTAPSLRVPVGICRVVRSWVGVVVKWEYLHVLLK